MSWCEHEGPTCSDCVNYDAAPAEWVSIPCGWCTEGPEHVRADESVARTGCESFEWR